jgi:hypothetical protein
MAITYQPDYSFIGTLHWQRPDGRESVHGLSATLVENAVTAVNNGWIYASVGDSYSGTEEIGLGMDHSSRRLVGLTFWFGCYYDDDESDFGYRYELRVCDQPGRKNPFQAYTLDVSRNGYLAVYEGHMPAYGSYDQSRAVLWRFTCPVHFDLSPGELEANGQVKDVTLLSPRGRKVRRLIEDYFPYLNDAGGDGALFSIKVEEYGVPRPWS